MKQKKPLSGFFYFLEDFRKEFQVRNPDVKSKRDEKAQYFDIATKKHDEFDSAMAEFNKKMISNLSFLLASELTLVDETDEESEFDE
ncbi:hypothetical protein GLYMA_05G128900v4 [Glycine max]|nr:hypothetical protein GLYMA_05G128900v4 [Glycine max]KAG4391120.1 hypothetical protein GLYMA_05G128900v4 [Glycine max]KAH1134095.1 hypothetical protein GYH30_012492 [Glycine max]KAH1134096.1 hypothetical protein GYH30_012492 [Glycine max]